MDIRLEMLEELRAQGRTIQPWQADEREQYLTAVVQVICALPTPSQQWAAMVLVANDLCLQFPGMPLAMAFLAIQQRMGVVAEEAR